MKRRASGILLHITSLPSIFGIGDMGPEAYRFVDFLAEANQNFWQILPLNPTSSGSNSPYLAISAFAGNPLLISPEMLLREGLLNDAEVKNAEMPSMQTVDYGTVAPCKEALFRLAFNRFNRREGRCEYRDFENFCQSQSYWIDDFALFTILKQHFQGKPWNKWLKRLRQRDSKSLLSIRDEMYEEFELARFIQFMFCRQWNELKNYCRVKGIKIIGDIPIYLDYDSADVWSHGEIFKLDENGVPYVVSGVPPDYFSENGQLWGNPVYQWDALKEQGYDWWLKRLEHNLTWTDFVRLDHFRGLVAYWEVPADEDTAKNGQWVDVPVLDFFDKILKRFPYFPVIAEDLGTITPDVREIISLFELPVMKVLLFAFEDNASNPYLPHNMIKNAIVYTGTHDNNTVRGWYESEADDTVKERLFNYLGRRITAEEAPSELIRLAMMSVANLTIFPMQDVLALGEEARMNRPAGGEGNWEWRLAPEQLNPDTARWLREMGSTYGRS